MGLFDFWKTKPSTPQPDTFEIVTLDQIHQIVNPLVMDILGPRGFETFSRLVWVNSRQAPIRQMFGFAQWKGGKLAPRWGLSLDFVPHISGKYIKWHRTPKSALFDLLIDSTQPSHDIYYTKGPNIIIEQAPMIVKSAISMADDFWCRFTTIKELSKAITAVEEEGIWHNKSYLTNAFVFATNGQISDSEKEFEKFLRENELESSVTLKLKALLENVRTEGGLQPRP